MSINKERRKMRLRYEGKFFLSGIFIGTLLGMVWQDFFYHYHFFEQKVYLSEIKQDSNKQLLEYLNGEWISPVVDLKIGFDFNNKSFQVFQQLDGYTQIIPYKIAEITSINGLMGLVKLKICREDIDCKETIPLQINKVFGQVNTITMTYDSRISFCSEPLDSCTRSLISKF